MSNRIRRTGPTDPAIVTFRACCCWIHSVSGGYVLDETNTSRLSMWMKNRT